MATVPVEITWTTGQVVTAAQLNTNIRDAINFILGPPMFVLRQTVAQSIADTTVTALTWDAEDLDRDNGHSTVTNTSRYTSQTTGWYDLHGQDGFASITSGGVIRDARFRVNAVATDLWGMQVPSVANAAGQFTISGWIFLNSGDFVEVYVQQFNGGAALNTAGPYGALKFGGRWESS